MIKSDSIQPISHLCFKELNKKVHILGFHPVGGVLLFMSAILLPITTAVFKLYEALALSLIYVVALGFYTNQNNKRITQNKSSLMSKWLANRDRKVYADNNQLLNYIIKRHGIRSSENISDT